ncbi:hypothetical protein DS901_15495 [Loktanella sp. D2R18]|nr:hypothetical protein DS901_15495 [Loktanella sp. D2R18]
MLKKAILVCKSSILASLLTSLPVEAEPENPLANLTQLLNYEAEEPDLNIVQATISDCILTLETLNRYHPYSDIVLTRTTVPLASLHGNISWLTMPSLLEEGGTRWSIAITGETATAFFRIDRPSRSQRRSFRDRLHQQCRGDMCQIDYIPSAITVPIRPSTLAEKDDLQNVMLASIDYCVPSSD